MCFLCGRDLILNVVMSFTSISSFKGLDINIFIDYVCLIIVLIPNVLLYRLKNPKFMYSMK